jgi:hypothetical protein
MFTAGCFCSALRARAFAIICKAAAVIRHPSRRRSRLRAMLRFAQPKRLQFIAKLRATAGCFISVMKSSTQTKTVASLRWPEFVGNCGMKSTKSAALGMLCALGFVSAVSADPPSSDRSQNLNRIPAVPAPAPPTVVVWNDHPTKYVVLTGSYIPQKVVLRSIGTNTTDPRRIYNRNEIDKTGRATTEDVLRLDPSLTVHSAHGSGVQ